MLVLSHDGEYSIVVIHAIDMILQKDEKLYLQVLFTKFNQRMIYRYMIRQLLFIFRFTVLSNILYIFVIDHSTDKKSKYSRELFDRELEMYGLFFF